MTERSRWLHFRLFGPETPLFLIGISVALIILLLTAFVIWSTFQRGLPSFDADWSLLNYIEVFQDPIITQAALNTLIAAIGTVLVSTFFAVPISWLIHRTKLPGKPFFVTAMLLLILIPGFLKAMGWIMLGSAEIGLINEILRKFIPVESGPLSVYNIYFIAFLQGVALTPSAFLMIAGAFISIDPTYEEAAEVCGASKFEKFRRITLPLIMPALIAAAIYNFMVGVSMFEFPALLGMPNNIYVFSTLMYTSIYPQVGLPSYGIAGVYGVILMIPSLFALYYYQRMIRASHRFATVTGKGYRPILTDLGKWKWAGYGFILFYFLIDLVLPFLAVLWTSVVPRIQLPSIDAIHTINLEGFRSAIQILLEGGVMLNTIQLILSVAFLSVIISMVFAWIVLRSRLPGRFAIDTISMLPHAIPGIAFAFSVSFVGILLVKIMPLYGSLLSIIIADTIRRLPFTTRTINGSLIQIHNELEEAVQICGGSKVVALRRVILPLILPAIFYSLIWAALHAYREVTIALFLQSPRNLVMATSIWQRWQYGDTATAAAMGVIMMAAMGVIILVLFYLYPQAFGERR